MLGLCGPGPITIMLLKMQNTNTLDTTISFKTENMILSEGRPSNISMTSGLESSA